MLFFKPSCFFHFLSTTIFNNIIILDVWNLAFLKSFLYILWCYSCLSLLSYKSVPFGAYLKSFAIYKNRKLFTYTSASRVGGKMQTAKHPTFLLHFAHYVGPLIHLVHQDICCVIHFLIPNFPKTTVHEWARSNIVQLWKLQSASTRDLFNTLLQIKCAQLYAYASTL